MKAYPSHYKETNTKQTVTEILQLDRIEKTLRDTALNHSSESTAVQSNINSLSKQVVKLSS